MTDKKVGSSGLNETQMTFYQANLKGKKVNEVEGILVKAFWGQKVSLDDLIHIAFVLGYFIGAKDTIAGIAAKTSESLSTKESAPF